MKKGPYFYKGIIYCGHYDEKRRQSILAVGNKEIADNYRKAVDEGDDREETDNAYYDFSPSPSEYLEEYVEKNRDVIFN